MLARPRFDAEDLAREQRVIIEEMKMVEDTPDEYLGELFNAAYFPNHPLGRPIEGTAETVSFNRERTIAYHKREYAPHNLVIAAAGNIEHARLVELATRIFSENAFDDQAGNASHNQSDDADSQSHTTTTPTHAAPILIERKRA
jgi:predicted Zn-dependent peptidase